MNLVFIIIAIIVSFSLGVWTAAMSYQSYFRQLENIVEGYRVQNDELMTSSFNMLKGRA